MTSISTLRELLTAATPGVLVAEGVEHQDGLNENYWDVDGGNGGWVCHVESEEMALLVAAAINALPDLLDALERAEAQVAAVEAEAEDWERRAEYGDVSLNQFAALVRAALNQT